MRIIIILITLIPLLGFGQQTKQLSLAMQDKFEWNPAYAGLDFSLSVTGVSRNQWTGLPGSPKSQSINAHLPIYRWSGGVGLQINNQSLGAYANTNLALSYAYIKSTRLGIFSTGIRVGVSQIRLTGNELITPDGNYEGNVIDHRDPTLSSRDLTGASANASLAMYFYSRKLEFGISYSDLVPNRQSLGETTYFLRQSHLNVGCLAKFNLKENLAILPSIMLKSDFNELQSDLITHIRYNGNIFGGIGVRGYSSTSLDAIIISAGLKLNPNYTLFYSFDLGISALRQVNEGSHEIILNYNLNKLIGVGMTPKVIYNPRYL